MPERIEQRRAARFFEPLQLLVGSLQLGRGEIVRELLTRSTAIIGGRTREQFADNLAAADLKLSGEELTRLEEASRPPLLYPYWHQAWSASDRLGAADLALLGPHLEA